MKFSNQGENDEIDVKILVAISGGPKAIALQKTLNQTKAGSPAEASIPLSGFPSTPGTPAAGLIRPRSKPLDQSCSRWSRSDRHQHGGSTAR